MAMMRKEILIDQQAASSSGTNNRQVVTDLERLNKLLLQDSLQDQFEIKGWLAYRIKRESLTQIVICR